MSSADRPTRESMQRRVRRAVRVLGLRTREYVAEASRAAHLHDADIHAVAVLREGREVTAGELARELALSPAAASALIDRMERAGHVERERSARDGRKVVVAATDSARATSDELFDPLVAAYEDVLAGYDIEQIALLAGFLEKLAKATREAAPGAGSGIHGQG